MSGYVGVREQVEKDFHRALLRASVYRWTRKLRGSDTHNDRLLSFEEAKSLLVRSSQAYRGMRVVEVEKVTGSVGGYRDFDRNFLPRRRYMSERWSRVDSAYHKGVELPAISLYKVGDGYFVRDGNHRVSVACYHEVAAIDAEVVELRGQMRDDAAKSTTREAGSSPQVRRDPAQPRASWLHKVWRHLRPALSSPSSATPQRSSQ
jgi:hypothetical protein